MEILAIEKAMAGDFNLRPSAGSAVVVSATGRIGLTGYYRHLDFAEFFRVAGEGYVAAQAVGAVSNGYQRHGLSVA